MRRFPRLLTFLILGSAILCGQTHTGSKSSLSRQTHPDTNYNLADRLEQLNHEYAMAAARGNFLRLSDIEAELNVLAADLTHVDPAGFGYVTDGLHLLDANSLDASLDYFQRRSRQMRIVAAQAPVPSATVELAEIEQIVWRLQSAKQKFDPGQYRHARDALPELQKSAQWNALSDDRTSRISSEQMAGRKVWRAKFAELAFTSEKPTAPHTRPTFSDSDLAYFSIVDMVDDPVGAIEKESYLRLKYEHIVSRARASSLPAQTFEQWRAGLLGTKHAQEAAVQLSSTLAQTEGDEVRPDLQQLRHRARDSLEAIKSSKPAANVSSVPHPVASQSSDYGAVELKLAIDRFGRPDLMPLALEQKSNDILRSSFDAKITDLKKTLPDIQGYQLYLSTRQSTESEMAALSQVRLSTQAVAQRIGDSIAGAEAMGFGPFPQGRSELELICRQTDTHMDWATATAPRVLTVHDPVLIAANHQLESSVQALPSKNKRKPLYQPTTLDQNRTLNESDMWKPGFDFSKELKADMPVRPGRQWAGLINPESNSPYDFEREVVPGKSVKPLGGGIHLGRTGELKSSDTDTKRLVLRYDPRTSELYLLGDNGQRYSYGPVSPEVLKALLQFAVSGHNAAVSVGWAGEKTIEDTFPSKEAVLLHPIFVNTPIGQDLIIVDSIPWDLSKEKLPGGADNPIHAQFAAVYSPYEAKKEAESGQKLLDLTNRAKRIEAMPDSALASKFKDDNIVGYLVGLLLQSKETSAALSEFSSTAEEQPNPKTRQAMLSLSKVVAREDNSYRALQLVAELMMEGSGPNDEWLDLWIFAAGKLHPSAKSAEVALAAYGLSSDTTIAVLIDAPVSITLQNGHILLQGDMVWKYLTTDSVHPRRRAAAEADRYAAGDIVELESVVQPHFAELREAYPPLNRVNDYARILALLRWCLRKDNIAGVDLTALSNVASSSPETPTPSFVERSK
jgi:hypothetical protein